MTEREYYTAPPQHVFDDIKRAAQAIWNTYDNLGGYRDEKLAFTDVENVSDNAWYLVAMFDLPNQNKLIDMVEPETAEYIKRAINS